MAILRPWKSFRENPSSLRWATLAIVSVSVSLVVIGAVIIRVFAASEYPTFGDAVWFTLQTITTVGYGDSTPVSAAGRLVASIVMLVSIGLLTVATAIVTSLFIESARRSRRSSNTDETAESLARVEAALGEIQARLERLER